MNVVLRIIFLALNNVDIQFNIKKLIRKTYTITKISLITSQVELIDKKKYIKVVLNVNLETFVMHISALVVIKRSIIHLF